MFSLVVALALLGGIPEDYTGVIWVHQDGCPACKQMEPVVYKLVAEGLPILVVKIKNRKEANDWDIRLTPSSLTVIKGKLKYRNEGVLDEKNLRHLVKLSQGEE